MCGATSDKVPSRTTMRECGRATARWTAQSKFLKQQTHSRPAIATLIRLTPESRPSPALSRSRPYRHNARLLIDKVLELERTARGRSRRPAALRQTKERK